MAMGHIFTWQWLAAVSMIAHDLQMRWGLVSPRTDPGSVTMLLVASSLCKVL